MLAGPIDNFCGSTFSRQSTEIYINVNHYYDTTFITSCECAKSILGGQWHPCNSYAPLENVYIEEKEEKCRYYF